MLGKAILDPMQIESVHTHYSGLGLFDYVTTLQQEKALTNYAGTITLNGQTETVKGYEIHCGVTQYSNQVSAVELNDLADGMLSQDNQIFSTYLHGLFDPPEALNLILNWAGLNKVENFDINKVRDCLLYTSPSPRDRYISRMPSSA